MKSKELMIGDWVQGFFPDTYSQIGQTTWNGSVIIFTRNGVEIDLNEEDVQPVPLTAEILEKNGWKCKVNGISTDVRGEIAKDVWFVMQLLDGYDHWNIRLSKVGAGETFDLFIQCKYVHELQRALRCCGLLDLANNIKIK